MRNTLATLSITAAVCMMAAQSASAQTTATDPCAGSANGSCSSNAIVQPIEISRPSPLRSSAFINQIGDANSASISQTSTNQFARIAQSGDNGSANVQQRGDGTAHLEVDQGGLLNSIVVKQDAATGGGNVAVAAQNGENNAILLDQSATSGTVNGAILAQQGTGNQMNLSQNGSDNRAELVQLGDNNAMTATQNGTANQLRWVQDGNGLSDLQIVQSGSQMMSITQTNGGS